MGHKHLLRLPKTHEWQQVVALLDGDSDVDEIASASAAAAERILERASDDALLTHAVWLLSQIPQAARGDNFQEQLGALGLDVRRDPSLLEIAGAFAQAMDHYARHVGGRSDLGEMAQHAAAEAFTSLAGRELPTLFGATASDVQTAIAGLGSPGRFSVLARDFFSRLTYRCLSYYLSRELSNHVGPGQLRPQPGAQRFQERPRLALSGSVANHQGILKRLVRQDALRAKRDQRGASA